MENQLWIILGSVLGFLVLIFVLTVALFCWKRPASKMRKFSIRAVTPLDDAEFESWRRPTQYTARREKYGIHPTPPPVAVIKTPTLWEKEVNLNDRPRTPPLKRSPTSPRAPSSITAPERARRKSSVSIADRPPTPYSPSSSTNEFVRTGSHASRGSPRSPKHLHYPSASDASDFNFNFEFSPSSVSSTGLERFSSQSARPLYDPIAIDQFSRR